MLNDDDNLLFCDSSNDSLIYTLEMCLRTATIFLSTSNDAFEFQAKHVTWEAIILNLLPNNILLTICYIYRNP